MNIVANLISFVSVMRASVHPHGGEIRDALSQLITFEQDEGGSFALGEARLCRINADKNTSPETSSRPVSLKVSLLPFSTSQGPLGEDLIEQLCADDASAARALFNRAHASVMHAWLAGTLGMRLGAELMLCRPEAPCTLTAAGGAPRPNWAQRISTCLTAGRAPSAKWRRLLRVMGASEPGAAHLVQLITAMCQAAGLGDIPVFVDAFAGGKHQLAPDQRFELGRARLGMQSVVGQQMAAASSCCDIELGPVDEKKLAQIDGHATLKAELIDALRQIAPSTQNFRITLRLIGAVQKPLTLACPNATAEARASLNCRLGQRSYLGRQKHNTRLIWLRFRA